MGNRRVTAKNHKLMAIDEEKFVSSQRCRAGHRQAVIVLFVVLKELN